MAKLNFNATGIKPAEAFEPVPRDWYPMVICESDVKPTRAKPGKAAGERVELTFQIIDGPYKGRRVFDGINNKNANPVAQEIGERQLAGICHAIKVFKFADTKELHDKPFEGKVGLENGRWVKDEKTVAEGTPGAEWYDPRNKFQGARPIGGENGAVAEATAQTPAFVKTPGAKVAPPAKTPPKEAEKPKVYAWAFGEGVTADSMFWVEVNGQPEDTKASDVLDMLNKGMPTETVVMLQDANGEGEWKTAADHFVQEEVTEAAPVEEAPPAKTPPPKKAPPAAAAKGDVTPPWKKK